jgi:hypothetical protein
MAGFISGTNRFIHRFPDAVKKNDNKTMRLKGYSTFCVEIKI